MKRIIKVDRFYMSVGTVLIVLTVLVAIVMRAIFSSLKIASEIDSEFLQSLTPRLEVSKIEEATKVLEGRKSVVLDLSHVDYVQINVEETNKSTEGGEQIVEQ